MFDDSFSGLINGGLEVSFSHITRNFLGDIFKCHIYPALEANGSFQFIPPRTVHYGGH